MKMNRALNSKEKVVLIVLLLILGFACYWNFVQRPVTEALDLCATETDELNTQIMILSAKKQKKDDMLKELEEIKASGNAPVVPDYDNLDRVMSFLYNVLATTKDYNLSVQSVAKSEEGSANIVRRNMTLDFTSSDYYSAKTAIRKLQESDFCCRLGAMSIRRESNDARSVLEEEVNVGMNITFFEMQKKG